MHDDSTNIPGRKTAQSERPELTDCRDWAERDTSSKASLPDQWAANITHEWLLIGVANADELSAPIHLALLYLTELHAELQALLASSGDLTGCERVLNRLAMLDSGPVSSVIPDLLRRFGSDLARQRRSPLKWHGEYFPSYSHALAWHRSEVAQLFGTSLLWHPDLDDIEYGDFVQNRRLEFERFRDREAGKSWRSCWHFVVEHNNGCFTGRDLAAYEKWLVTHAEWNFTASTAAPAPLPEMAPLSSKSLQGLLAISSETLRDYRRKAGLPKGSRGKSVVWTSKDVVALCEAIIRECPTPGTRERAIQLETKYIPDCQIS